MSNCTPRRSSRIKTNKTPNPVNEEEGSSGEDWFKVNIEGPRGRKEWNDHYSRVGKRKELKVCDEIPPTEERKSVEECTTQTICETKLTGSSPATPEVGISCVSATSSPVLMVPPQGMSGCGVRDDHEEGDGQDNVDEQVRSDVKSDISGDGVPDLDSLVLVLEEDSEGDNVTYPGDKVSTVVETPVADHQGSGVGEFTRRSLVDNVEKERGLMVKLASLPSCVTFSKVDKREEDAQVEENLVIERSEEVNVNSDMIKRKKISGILPKLPACITTSLVGERNNKQGGGGERMKKCHVDRSYPAALPPQKVAGIARLELDQVQAPVVNDKNIVDLTGDDTKIEVNLMEVVKEEKIEVKEELTSTGRQGAFRSGGYGEMTGEKRAAGFMTDPRAPSTILFNNKRFRFSSGISPSKMASATGIFLSPRQMSASPRRFLSPRMSSLSHRKLNNPRQTISPRHIRFLSPSKMSPSHKKCMIPRQMVSPRRMLSSYQMSSNPRRYVESTSRNITGRRMSPNMMRPPCMVTPPRRFLFPATVMPPRITRIVTAPSRPRLQGREGESFAPEVNLVLPCAGPGKVEIKLNCNQVNQLWSGLQGVKIKPGGTE